MSEYVLTDQALTEAADCVVTAMLDSLPPPSECDHTFSPEFEAKMEKLLKQAKRKRKPMKTMQRVAAVFLAVVVGTGVFFTVDAEARAAFFGWIKETYETYFVYRFSGEETSQEKPKDYRLGQIPDGYEFKRSSDTGAVKMTTYKNEAGQLLEFHYIYDPESVDLLADAPGMDASTVFVHDYAADLTVDPSGELGNNLIWTNEFDETFQISGFFSGEELIALAESITDEPMETQYALGWLPEGYSLLMEDYDEDTKFIAYTHENGEMLKFSYVVVPDETTWFVDVADTTKSQVSVNGCPAELFISNSPDVGSGIIWSNEANTAFYIGGFMSEDDLVKLAESVCVVK